MTSGDEETEKFYFSFFFHWRNRFPPSNRIVLKMRLISTNRNSNGCNLLAAQVKKGKSFAAPVGKHIFKFRRNDIFQFNANIFVHKFRFISVSISSVTEKEQKKLFECEHWEVIKRFCRAKHTCRDDSECTLHIIRFDSMFVYLNALPFCVWFSVGIVAVLQATKATEEDRGVS